MVTNFLELATTLNIQKPSGNQKQKLISCPYFVSTEAIRYQPEGLSLWGFVSYSHCTVNQLTAENYPVSLYSTVITRAYGFLIINLVALLKTWSFHPVLHKSQPSFAPHLPPLVAVEQLCTYPRCMPIASSVADTYCNLISCDDVMSMQ